MTVSAGAICFACKRWNGHVCEAFPDGIPESIMFDGFDHRQPHEGDHDLRFVLGDQKRLDAYEAMMALIAGMGELESEPEAEPEFKHGRKGEPGYELLHPGRVTDLMGTGVFRRFTADDELTDFVEKPDRIYPLAMLTSEAARVRTKGLVGRSLRARLRADPRTAEALDAIEFKTIVGGRHRPERSASLPEADNEAYLIEKWEQAVGADNIEGYLFEDVPTENLEREVKLAILTRSYIDTWAHSAADHDPTSIALQLGVEKWAKARFGDEVGALEFNRQVGEQVFKDEGAFVGLFVEAVYEETQALLREKGIETVKVHRGMYFPSPPRWALDQLPRGTYGPMRQRLPGTLREGGLIDGKVQVVLNPASSWSANSHTAEAFAERAWNEEARVAMTLETEVPASYIWSLASTGPGSLDESEIITLSFPLRPKVAWWNRQS